MVEMRIFNSFVYPTTAERTSKSFSADFPFLKMS